MRAAGTRQVAVRLLAGAVLLSVAGCTSSGGHRTSATSSTTATSATTATTAPGVQTSGSRTVLSPLGLNVRAQPLNTAKVLGTAARGVVLTVLGHTASSGGWFQVKGATVTGWISADPALSAQGEFRSYSSAQFNALYPATWTASTAPPSSEVFRPVSGADSIVVTPAAAVSQLPHGRNGYGQSGAQPILVCGVTSYLVTYHNAATPSTTSASTTTTAGSPATASLPYLAEVRVAVDAHHALGFYGNLSDLGTSLQVFRNLLASATFPAPQCTG